MKPGAAGDIVPDAVRALARGEFGGVAKRFSSAGCVVAEPARGMLTIHSPAASPAKLSLLLSVGVHGDETAPIEMLASLLDRFWQAPHALAVDLMLVVGNPEAIAQGRRYIDADLNRLFYADRGNAATMATEAPRADAIMREVGAFFAGAASRRWHLDLHAAIRPSLYPAFAVVPDGGAERESECLLAWLGGAGIDAVILNPKPAGVVGIAGAARTFSAWSALHCGALSATLELGRIGAFGANDLAPFSATQDALDALLRLGATRPLAPKTPQVFVVAQEIVKHSEAFTMALDQETQNFTAMAPGAQIARDGEIVYRVGPKTEYVVFPNPAVKLGLRAGLMVVRRG